ncbi:transferase hexapeptide repeat containing protein [Cronbergia sp. UHCC 0137]|uniref:transferase hexapeptide repeat containing protein n=1 Tax=Cronbergia sp. UHCC 0137 TaxID=3110239 RepID=UPI002B21E4F7|nr:transferase hexapeptide repeat containing protein [Cronbergia sp. UHCC 0137]MEA5618127.1 transferase hexapeptide repeat containing protein [Cronbergia sp. UHCC 0137]
MLDTSTLEQRLINLEQVVFDLQHKFDTKPTSENWLERLIGSISDDAAFLKALEYGRAFRQSDKPIDDSGK